MERDSNQRPSCWLLLTVTKKDYTPTRSHSQKNLDFFSFSFLTTTSNFAFFKSSKKDTSIWFSLAGAQLSGLCDDKTSRLEPFLFRRLSSFVFFFFFFPFDHFTMILTFCAVSCLIWFRKRGDHKYR